MTIKEILKEAALKLSEKNISTSRLDAEVLLMYVLKKTKEWIYINNDKNLSPAQGKKFNKIIKERQKRKPIAQLINSKEFYGLNFYVDKNVLTPRPETEGLLELALEKIKNIKNKIKNIRIAEIGVGSGCIAITLAKEIAKPRTQNLELKIVATDISEKALKVARKNAKTHKVSRNIKFIKSNLLDNINDQFDIIISNPPYVPKSSKLEKELSFEPKKALFPKKTFLKELLESATAHLKNGGYIFLEIDPTWKKEICKLKNNILIEQVIFKKDLRKNTRYAIIKKKP